MMARDSTGRSLHSMLFAASRHPKLSSTVSILNIIEDDSIRVGWEYQSHVELTRVCFPCTTMQCQVNTLEEPLGN